MRGDRHVLRDWYGSVRDLRLSVGSLSLKHEKKESGRGKASMNVTYSVHSICVRNLISLILMDYPCQSQFEVPLTVKRGLVLNF